MKYISVFTLFALLLPQFISCIEQKVYIVYLGSHSGEKTHSEIEEYHNSYLYSLRGSKEQNDSLLYSYKNSINGFAAMLTPDEALKLSELDEVVSVIPSTARTLHTTRSWEFLGVSHGEQKENSTVKDDLWSKAAYGKGIIVGLLDSGIWPESKSFNDEGMSPIPKSWKGICQTGDAFNSSHCNKKIIGARYYLKGFEKVNGPVDPKFAYRSPRDNEGHGTHTSSTVGGRIVQAQLDGGFGNGTASGGAPLVHLAMYKICWPLNDGRGDACFEEDILAAIDDAIGDGVDVLSMSIGGAAKGDYAKDVIAIGSLHAAQKNIFVACSAGNNGLSGSSTVSNAAPWIFTVAASTVDRSFSAPLSLGVNGTKIPGESVTINKLKEQMYPLVYAGDIKNGTADSSLCIPGSFSPGQFNGKIVFCQIGGVPLTDKGDAIRRVGGIGLVVGNVPDGGDELLLDANVLPATQVGSDNALKILEYINSTKTPVAYINPTTTSLNVKPAPKMTSFSSRGPNSITPEILKPDITAPGINILAAWPGDTLSSPGKYKLESGTSMSCPHVAGIAALIKAIHPTWSSAAIRSAIMTTALQTNNMGTPITDFEGVKADPFHYGSGHINPTRAADPGLVYDASYSDYLLFLCRRDKQAVDKSFKCPPNLPSLNNLNYPSLAISKLNGTVSVERVVTNVGDTGANYKSEVEAPPGVSVKVEPSVLSFQQVGEKKKFTITISAAKSKFKNDNYVFGSYSWTDGVHVVRSPTAINLA